jgi:hypothetical protein
MQLFKSVGDPLGLLEPGPPHAAMDNTVAATSVAEISLAADARSG